MDYYNTYNSYLRRIFNSRVRKISIDAGFSCPNIDGKIDTKGCLFCNNKAFSGINADEYRSIEEQIEVQLNNKGPSKNTKYLAYFQSFTNTYEEPDKLYDIYKKIKKYPPIAGLIIGTRPDEIDHDKLSVLKRFADEGYYVSIELGVQTSKDETLLFINRGHFFDAIKRASEMISEYKFDLGAHVILGLPMETERDYITTAQTISRIGFNIVKIHQLQVFKNTRLHNLFQQGIVDIFSMNGYLKALVTFLENLSPDIAISRIFAQGKEDFLIAPKWNLNKNDFIRSLTIEFNKRKTYQGKYYTIPWKNPKYQRPSIAI